MIVEGGNLGLSQRASHRLCSPGRLGEHRRHRQRRWSGLLDHEVNIKILLDSAARPA